MSFATEGVRLVFIVTSRFRCTEKREKKYISSIKCLLRSFCDPFQMHKGTITTFTGTDHGICAKIYPQTFDVAHEQPPRNASILRTVSRFVISSNNSRRVITGSYLKTYLRCS
jgi:hypothetical protein